MKTELSEEECLGILGVSEADSLEFIKEQRDFLQKANHPERFQGAGEKKTAIETYKRISRAYRRLVAIRKERERVEPKSVPVDQAVPTPEDRPPWQRMFSGWFTRETVGPPPRSSKDTLNDWPHLKQVHRLWLHEQATDEEEEEDDADEDEENEAATEIHWPKEDTSKLTLTATKFVEKAKLKGLDGHFYWAAEAEQNANVCYLRFLKPIIGDVCARVEVVLAKQTHLTYGELKVSTVLWWRPAEVKKRLALRSLTVIAWLLFSALATAVLPSGTGTGAVAMMLAGLLILAFVAHWDIHVDYGKVDWKMVYPIHLWRERFAFPALIQVVGFFAWRIWSSAPSAVFVPALVWLVGYWLWKSVTLVDYPEEDLGERPQRKDVEVYLNAVGTILTS